MLTPIESVLVLCAGVVGNLESGAPLVRILKKVDVRALIEPVMRRVVGLRSVEVVYVSVACSTSQTGLRCPAMSCYRHSQRGYVLLSRPGGHLAAGALQVGGARASMKKIAREHQNFNMLSQASATHESLEITGIQARGEEERVWK